MSIGTYPAKIVRRTEIPGPQSRRWLNMAKQTVAPPYEPLHPIIASRAHGALIEDVDGNRFIDLTGGVGSLNVGHTATMVVEAIREQAGRFLHTDYSVIPYEPLIRLANRLVQLTPGRSPKKVAFANSGAESIENAVKIAQRATRRSGIIAFEGAFHGRTWMAMSLSSKTEPYKRGYFPRVAEVYRVPYPYPYRCPFGSVEPDACRELALETLERAFRTQVSAAETAAIIVEPIQGEGGFVVPPAGFLRGLRSICDRYGVLLIVDEIQTGFGRTGKMFAVEWEGIEPDILCVAKSLAAGMPLSAVIARADLMDEMEGGSLGGTYPGNPVACVAALAALDVMEQPGYLEHANRLGEQIASWATRLMSSHMQIGEVRGLGSMVGIELVRHPETREPFPELANAWVDASRRRGVLLAKAGLEGNVIRFLHPLTMPQEEMAEALDAVEQALPEALRSVSASR